MGFLILLAVAFTGSGAAHLIARQMPVLGDTFGSYTWTILIVSLLGMLASFTPLRRMERFGASRTGYELLYLVLASIGARASMASGGSVVMLTGAGMLIVAIHLLFLLAGARLLRAPLFLVAAASQANIGGVASAPVVAEVYRPGLAPVGLLMALLGNILGTWLGILCGQVCRKL